MLSEWHEFLTQSGAIVQDGQVEGFGDSQGELHAAVDGDVLVDLSHLGLLRVSGPDSQTFLQGQFTNDVRRVTAERSQLSSYLSPKGRILTAFRLFKRDDDYYLCMPQALAAPTLERLRKYVLMSKVTLADAGEQLVRIGVSGPRAVASLAQLIGGVPQQADETTQRQGLTVIRISGPHPRVELYGAMAAVQAVWQALRSEAVPAGAPAWALLDIRAGIPSVHPATVEAFVPQMINLQIIDGVSFRKGCYTGQEVVARMQYLGKLKRRMYLAHVDAGAPHAGDELYCANSESGQGAGKVVDAQPAPEGGYDLLAVVQASLFDSGDVIRLNDADGPQLQFKMLPYAFPADEAPAGQSH